MTRLIRRPVALIMALGGGARRRKGNALGSELVRSCSNSKPSSYSTRNLGRAAVPTREICSARRERTAQKAAWIEGQARSVCESRAKLEAAAEARAAEADARKRAEAEHLAARERELAATTQVHAPPGGR